MISQEDIARVTEACRVLPEPTGNYFEDDFLVNLIATVVDFQTHMRRWSGPSRTFASVFAQTSRVSMISSGCSIAGLLRGRGTRRWPNIYGCLLYTSRCV